MRRRRATDVKGDWHQMSLSELELYLDTPTDNMEIVACVRLEIADRWRAERRTRSVLKMLNKYKVCAWRRAATHLSWLRSSLPRIPLANNTLPGVFYLKLGGRLEASNGFDDAGLCYRRVFDMDKTTKESEVALMRLGRLLETHYQNPDQAREAYTALC